MGNQLKLKCTRCHAVYTNLSYGSCNHCGGILLADYGEEAKIGECYPQVKPENQISLGEGGTPCLDGERLNRQLGLSALWMKDESRNPTGSFKDRAMALCVSVAKEAGCRKIVVASSGNGAASAAAYGARAEMETIVVIPAETPVGKIAHAQTCGAKIIRVQGTFDHSFRYAQELAMREGIRNLTTTFLSPIGVEGYKTIAWEMFRQIEPLPEYCFIPVGAGPILYGIYKGFAELMQRDLLPVIPKLVAVQSVGCAPIATAWEQGRKTAAWKNPDGIASAISDPLTGYEDNGDLTLQAIHKTGGFAISVSDEEILKSGRLLAKCEGLFVEPSSSAALAGLQKALQIGKVYKKDSAILILTGSGLKDANRYIE